MSGPTSTRPEPELDPPAGWLTHFRRGAISGAAVLLLVWMLVCVPAMCAWLVPSADSVPASSAVKAAAIATVSSLHGGIRLDGTLVTMPPLLITVVMAAVFLGPARRFDSHVSLAGMVCGFAVSTAALASWARLGTTYAPVARSLTAAILFASVLGGGARALTLLWPRVPRVWREVTRSAAALALLYVGAAALVCAGAFLTHWAQAAEMLRTIAPGASGLPVTLIGLAAAPNAVGDAVGYLAGPGFDVGASTHISVGSTGQGRLPVFPLLAALPSSRGSLLVGLGLVGAVCLAGGLLTHRMLSDERGWAGRALDLLGACLLAAAGLAALTSLAGGGVGTGALSHVGARAWLVGPAVALGSYAASMAWWGAAAAWSRLRSSLSGPPRLVGQPAGAVADPAPPTEVLPEVAPAAEEATDRLRSTG